MDSLQCTNTIALVNAVFTFLLFIAAGVAAFLAWRNLGVLREQNRRNTFLILLNELAEKDSRNDRAIIHGRIHPEHSTTPKEHARYLEILVERGREGKDIEVKDAIEETIARLDRVGFFLLRGDPRLKDEAPEGMWTITSQMWQKLGDYVKLRQETHEGYGKYFEELAEEYRKRKQQEAPKCQTPKLKPK
jgi:hypothetical protein